MTYEGEGHGAYPTGDSCVRAAVDGYFPARRDTRLGTRCG
ncbi:alpha/beta hydrolase [Streptomyces sp. NPDC088554]